MTLLMLSRSISTNLRSRMAGSGGLASPDRSARTPTTNGNSFFTMAPLVFDVVGDLHPRPADAVELVLPTFGHGGISRKVIRRRPAPVRRVVTGAQFSRDTISALRFFQPIARRPAPQARAKKSRQALYYKSPQHSDAGAIMPKCRCPFALILLTMGAMNASADEGMWLLNDPPRAKLKEKYDFDLTDAWLEHAQKASVRFNNGGSGGFVSPTGSIVTNHHIGADCVQKLSPKADQDLFRDGFYAATRAEELKCPDLELNVLQSIEDVTDAGQRRGQAGHDAGRGVRRPPGRHGRHREGIAGQDRPAQRRGHALPGRPVSPLPLQEVHRRAPGLRPGAGHRRLRRRRRQLRVPALRPRRLLLPRLRERQAGQGRSTSSSGASKGPAEGDLVFVTGHPGTTNRLETLAKLQHRRDRQPPVHARPAAGDGGGAVAIQRARARASGAWRPRTCTASPTPARRFSGQYQGLLDPAIIAARTGRGAQPAQKLAAGIDKSRRLAAHRRRAEKTLSRLRDATTTCSSAATPSTSELFAIARHLVRLAGRTPKPNADRLREYRDSNLESLKFQLFSPAPIHPELERAKLAGVADLPGREPAAAITHDWSIRKVLAGQAAGQPGPPNWSPARKLVDPAERKRLVDGGMQAIEQSTIR